MPRVKKVLPPPDVNNEKILKELLLGFEGKKYIIMNYDYFYDYYKLVSTVSKEFVIQYIPGSSKNPQIEITAKYNVSINVRIPIIKTNIDEIFLMKITYVTPYSKYNNGFLLFVFDENTISYRYVYNSKFKTLRLDNSLFQQKKKEITINSDDHLSIKNEEKFEEEDEYGFNMIDKETEYGLQQNDTSLNFSSMVDEKIELFCDTFFSELDLSLIQSVVAHLSIGFDHLKEIFTKFGNSKVQIELFQNTIELNSASPTHGKKRKVTLKVINVDKSLYNTRLSFFIRPSAITQFKTLTSSFSVVPYDDKKIFSKVELKIVYKRNESESQTGITLFPGNVLLDRINSDEFDIYNSVMIFIPESG